MTNSRVPRSLTRIVFGLLLAGTIGVAQAQVESGPMRVYQDADGETYFSLSVTPKATNNTAAAPRDIVVLFDTSASQAGMFRETALAALESCLGRLSPNDRVRLVAADLDARPMSGGFESARSAAGVSLGKLRDEAPLGSTDLSSALKASIRMLADSRGPRQVLYIGDGVSSANLLDGPEFASLVRDLRAARVSVTSYAVGPQRDAQALAAIANQTGGNLYVDQEMTWADDAAGVTVGRALQENRRRGAEVGRTLAEWAAGEVQWTERLTLGDGVAAVYPESVPPLRSDRDTVLVGRLSPNTASINLELQTPDGGTAVISRRAPAAAEAYSYLANLVSEAERDGGLTLTTLGVAGLDETARLHNAGADELTGVAERAVASGDLSNAGKIAQAVLRRDPGNLRAQTVQRVVENGPRARRPVTPANPRRASTTPPKANPSGDLSLIRTAQVPEELAAPPTAPIDRPQNVPNRAPLFIDSYDVQNYPDPSVVVDGGFVDSVERRNRVFAQLLEKEVQVVISQARDIMSDSPEDAIQQLKLAKLNVDQAPELIATVRASLNDRLKTALRAASRAAALKDVRDRELQEVQAAARERQLLLNRFDREQEKERQLMSRFNALIDEQFFAEAQEVAEIVEEIDPNGVTPRLARLYASAKEQQVQIQALRNTKAQAFVDSLYQVELAAVPFVGDPPIVYPDAEEWQALSARRLARYGTADTAGEGEAERLINQALQGPLTSVGLDFQDTPLEEVVDFLREEYEIQIQLDTVALDSLGLRADEPISANYNNITLRSALRLMLKTLELTYIVADEVLLITTEEEAETRLVAKVYPVGDLVLNKAPIVSGGGGFGGGGGGFGGGGGGGGLGGGGGGGGFGGGGGGGGGFGGGGGGQFRVPGDAVAEPAEDLLLTNRSAETPSTAGKTPVAAEQAAASKPAGKQPEPTPTRVDTTVPADVFWDSHFATETRDPKQVRADVRSLMKDRQPEQVVALIQAALRSGQHQPWMYESLGIAMQLAGSSPHEVERAIMSATDFTRSPDELMLIGRYLLRLERFARAAQVYRQVTKIDPLRHEAYVLALRSAEQADDLETLKWATVGVLSQAWTQGQQGIQTAAQRLAKSTLHRLKEEGRHQEHADFQAELSEALSRDCVLRVEWTGDADVDLLVEEPGGTICSLAQPRTSAGGVSLGDGYSIDPDKSVSFAETYVCPKGFNGDYRALVRRVWGDVTANTVTVSLMTRGADGKVHRQRQQIDLGKGEAVVRFELDAGRRTDKIEDQQLAQALSRQQLVGRSVLAQQLGSLADPRVTPLRPQDRARARAALAGGGSVGFQPVIQVLPDGTQFITSAVTSADRRYVIVRPSPNFTTIGDVATFTFAGAGGDGDDDDAAAGGIVIGGPPAVPVGDGG